MKLHEYLFCKVLVPQKPRAKRRVNATFMMTLPSSPRSPTLRRTPLRLFARQSPCNFLSRSTSGTTYWRHPALAGRCPAAGSQTLPGHQLAASRPPASRQMPAARPAAAAAWRLPAANLEGKQPNGETCAPPLHSCMDPRPTSPPFSCPSCCPCLSCPS